MLNYHNLTAFIFLRFYFLVWLFVFFYYAYVLIKFNSTLLSVPISVHLLESAVEHDAPVRWV